MSEQNEAVASEKPAKKKGPKVTASTKAKLSRKTLRDRRRATLRLKLAADKEFAKTFFEARSKRSTLRKTTFRKRHSKAASA